MSFLSKIIRFVIAPLWAFKEKSPYLQYMKSITSMHHRSISEIQNDQLKRLEQLIKHASQYSDFHSLRLKDIIDNNKSFSMDDFKRIPILTKEDIRKHKSSMISRNIPLSAMLPRKTSGSTGVSLELVVDEKSNQWKRAVTAVYDRWSGWDIGERVGAIWGNPEIYQNWRLYIRNILLTRHIYLDTLQMDEQAMRSYHAKLVAKKPAILFGHAHSLFLFARFLEINNLTGIKPKGIISTCMVLHDFERQTIERVFDCHVTNRYGCEEVSLIACECSYGNMHINNDTLFVEFIRDGEPVPFGEPGSIVITDLTNYAMPIIRYKVGDVGVQSKISSCLCGCNYPILQSLEGRVADYVVTPEGKYISGISLTENFSMRLPGVKQMQIVQKKINQLLFRIVKSEDYNEHTIDQIYRLAADRFGNSMKFEVELTDSIQSEISGKYRFCISDIPNPFS